jgi:hypothetical protein
MCHVVFILCQFPLFFEPFYLLTVMSYLTLQCADTSTYYTPVSIIITYKTQLLKPWYDGINWDSLITSSSPSAVPMANMAPVKASLSACMFTERDYNEWSGSNKRLCKISQRKTSLVSVTYEAGFLQTSPVGDKWQVRVIFTCHHLGFEEMIGGAATWNIYIKSGSLG